MARTIVFFNRETMTGPTPTGNSEYFSEVFDVSDVNVLTVQLQVHGTNTGSTISGFIQDTVDPTFTTWRDVSPGLGQTGSGVGSATSKQTYSGLARFVRAKVVVPSTTTATISLCAVGRDGA